MEKYAIIDLGSNSVRLNIYHVKSDGSYYLLESVKEKVRLSEGMEVDNRIKDEPLIRTIQTLKLFQSLIGAHKIDALYPLATAAVRNSNNQEAVLKRIEGETGLSFRVLTGVEEAEYDYLGVINTIALTDFVLVDIGGASTEIVLVENRSAKKAISIPYGSVNLTEKFIKRSGFKAGMKQGEAFLETVLSELKWLKKAKGLPLVGLGGAVRTFAKIDRNANGYPIYSVHNYCMAADEVYGVFKRVMSFEPSNIEQLPGVGKKRADILQGGLLPLKVIFDQLQSEALYISENGLREGRFFEQLAVSRGNSSTLFPHVLDESLENQIKRLKVNRIHAENILESVTHIFKALEQSGKASPHDYKILRVAAYLHDIGLFINYDQHHRHGFYMMMHLRLFGLTNRETLAVAYLISRHRSSDNKYAYMEYDGLIKALDITQFDKYTPLLQIAEQLDRSESGRIQTKGCQIEGSRLILTLATEVGVDLELQYAQQIEPLFKKHFGLSLELCVL